eukprot:CAMPEP_0171216478 /NCGR_PEP_ID=MMETSP0790-20130122/32201_1 /TAXON_ID=2925 /ORGANISM="Alexandrium catenella, Strain OF101" /LENGTH=357 /DNA_ID=CAMNT_0011682259 /DNA_START=128 /DNA_END=1198 /DNA_ORIENTATION=-
MRAPKNNLTKPLQAPAAALVELPHHDGLPAAIGALCGFGRAGLRPRRAPVGSRGPALHTNPAPACVQAAIAATPVPAICRLLRARLRTGGAPLRSRGPTFNAAPAPALIQVAVAAALAVCGLLRASLRVRRAPLRGRGPAFGALAATAGIQGPVRWRRRRRARVELPLQEALLVAPAAAPELEVVDLRLGEPLLAQEALVHRLRADIAARHLAQEDGACKLANGAHRVARLFADLALRRLASGLAPLVVASWKVPTRAAPIWHFDKQGLVVSDDNTRCRVGAPMVEPLGAVAPLLGVVACQLHLVLHDTPLLYEARARGPDAAPAALAAAARTAGLGDGSCRRALESALTLRGRRGG